MGRRRSSKAHFASFYFAESLSRKEVSKNIYCFSSEALSLKLKNLTTFKFLLKKKNTQRGFPPKGFDPVY